MDYATVRNKIRSAIGKWYYQHDGKSPESFVRYNYYSKWYTCSEKRLNKNGTMYTKRCRSPLCCRCSRFWARKQSNNLISCYQNAGKENFRCMTIMIGITKNIEDVYPMFKSFRSQFKQSLHNKRRSIKQKSLRWKEFGMSGTLEIDVFSEKDHHLLGPEKKKQLEEKLGYKHQSNSIDSVWCVHLHSVAFIGNLLESEIEELVLNSAKEVHFEHLDPNKNRNTSIFTILRYGAKVNFSRKLPGNELIFWNKSQIESYCNIVSTTNRNSYKCFIGSVGSRQRKSVIKSIYL